MNNHDQQDEITQNSSRSTGKKLKSWGGNGAKAGRVMLLLCCAGGGRVDESGALRILAFTLSIPVIIGSGVIYGVGSAMYKYEKWKNKSKSQQSEDEQFQEQYQDSDSCSSTSIMLQDGAIEQLCHSDLTR